MVYHVLARSFIRSINIVASESGVSIAEAEGKREYEKSVIEAMSPRGWI